MSEVIDDLTIEYEEGGVVLVKELDKQVLTRGAWSTIVFKYQEWNAKEEQYGPVKFSIRRYQKRNGIFNQRSKFNISNEEQARKVVEVLNHWLDAEDEKEV